ncbi:MAG TPA: right-handed parallel beta-helix repeat-containing protein [Solirubrobacteraceae bacterium]|nr:right-handed parallel beta-helix repeat-containing protein [Solirubrobacteraceae bacterium]
MIKIAARQAGPRGLHGFLLFVLTAAALTLGAVMPSASLAATCTVVNSATSQSYTSLQVAVNASKAGDTLMITGTCAGETTVDRNLTLERAAGLTSKPTLLGRVTVTEGVAVGFTQLKLTNGVSAPKGGTLYVERCTLTGDISGSEKTTLQMVSSHLIKAGIALAGSASITKSVITGSSGAGISVLGNIEITSSTISKNAGIGIKGHAGNIVLTSSKVIGNKGGGIEDDRATIYLSNSTVTGNTGAEHGGGIAAFQATVQLAGTSAVSKNSTTGEGGGIWASDNTEVVLEGSASVKANAASEEGGGIYASGHTFVTLNDEASVKNNVTASRGAGIFAGIAFSEEEPTKVTLGGSSLVAGNKASGAGGGVYLRAIGSVLELVGSSSIEMNEAGTSGGGVFIGKNEFGAGTLIFGSAWNGLISGNRPDNVFAE